MLARSLSWLLATDYQLSGFMGGIGVLGCHLMVTDDKAERKSAAVAAAADPGLSLTTWASGMHSQIPNGRQRLSTLCRSRSREAELAEPEVGLRINKHGYCIEVLPGICPAAPESHPQCHVLYCTIHTSPVQNTILGNSKQRCLLPCQNGQNLNAQERSPHPGAKSLPQRLGKGRVERVGCCRAGLTGFR
jgi:hypothetical protein